MVEGPIANGGLPIRGARGRGGRSLGSIRLEEGDYLEGQGTPKPSFFGTPISSFALLLSEK